MRALCWNALERQKKRILTRSAMVASNSKAEGCGLKSRRFLNILPWIAAGINEWAMKSFNANIWNGKEIFLLEKSFNHTDLAWSDSYRGDISRGYNPQKIWVGTGRDQVGMRKSPRSQHRTEIGIALPICIFLSQIWESQGQSRHSPTLS